MVAGPRSRVTTLRLAPRGRLRWYLARVSAAPWARRGGRVLEPRSTDGSASLARWGRPFRDRAMSAWDVPA